VTWIVHRAEEHFQQMLMNKDSTVPYCIIVSLGPSSVKRNSLYNICTCCMTCKVGTLTLISYLYVLQAQQYTTTKSEVICI